MSKIDTLQKKLDTAMKALEKRKRYRVLPFVVFDPNTGEIAPEHQEIEEDAAARLVNVKCYGFDPSIEGTYHEQET